MNIKELKKFIEIKSKDNNYTIDSNKAKEIEELFELENYLCFDGKSGDEEISITYSIEKLDITTDNIKVYENDDYEVEVDIKDVWYPFIVDNKYVLLIKSQQVIY
ncbi:hypothetical protein SH1V18_48040 [Vallitalea longa]|uniref:Uncharacterized protein n=1 Tax=Vallitalea longa TaxID=2936439 RepID=A0A9W5YFX4_9FIRM|nr:hypothetical protein [Vallitalea longa]GKX32324.1 hypothetical protein SH1V18_48040 [Vallitalea longa]